MGLLEKALAGVMFPLSIIIILGEVGISVKTGFSVLLIGSLLMIALQVISIVYSRIHNNTFRLMHVLTGLLLILPPILYLLPVNYYREILPIIIGVMLFTESLYAFH